MAIINKVSKHHISEHSVNRLLSQEWVEANCQSVSALDAARILGYKHLQSGGLLLKGVNSMVQLRPDNQVWQGAPKYITPKKETMPYDAMLFNHPNIDNYWTKENLEKRCIVIEEKKYVLLTEGMFKAICCGQNNLPCVALVGVTMGMVGKDTNPNKPLVPSLQKITEMGYGIIIAFDSDVASNMQVRKAHKSLAEKLINTGTEVLSISGLWTEEEGKGLDDYINEKGIDNFKQIFTKAISIKKWNTRFPVFDGVKLDRSIELTMMMSLFDDDWIVLNDVFYQYQRGCDGELGFYKKVENATVKKLITTKLRDVFEVQEEKKEDGSVIPCAVYRFATEKNKQSVFKFSQSDLHKKAIANEHLIPFLNGTLNIRTGELEDHCRKNQLTWNIPSEYKPSSKCPQNFELFIRSAFGEEYIDLIQAIFSMYLDTTAPYGYFLHVIGKSGSGKGTLLRLLASLFSSDNAMAISNFDELGKTDKRHQLLTGKRFCYFPDVQGFQGGLTSFYELVDNGMLSGRALHSNDGYMKRWNTRFALASVSHLGIENAGTGWDRRCIPLATKPRKGDIDNNLFQKLSDERAEIISWSLGLEAEKRDKIIQGASNDYSGIRELKQQAAIYSDSMKGFIDQCLEPGIDGQTLSTDYLYCAYRIYCLSTGLKPIAQNKLISRLADELPHNHKSRTSTKVNGVKVNIPRHFNKIKFVNLLFERKDDEWHCNRGLLSEGNLSLFEEGTQAEPEYSRNIEQNISMTEYDGTKSESTLQDSNSSNSTYSSTKPFYLTEEEDIDQESNPSKINNKKENNKPTLSTAEYLSTTSKTAAPQQSQHTHLIDTQVESCLNTVKMPEYTFSIGNRVMSKYEQSIASKKGWVGVVVKIEDEICYVDFPDRKTLYKKHGGSYSGNPKTVITMKKNSLIKICEII